MSRPTLAELRAVCQPASTMSRRNGEHWLAVLFYRRVSLPLTSLLVRTPVSANQLTVLMIAVGGAAAAAYSLGGLGWALGGLALVQAYFLLDLCDGEVARWRRATSLVGVYLDRVGHYVVEAALMAGYGWRAGAGHLGGWTTLGVATGLFVVLVKAETDLVDTARSRAGLPSAPDSAAVPRSAGLARARRAGSVLKVHTITGALESSLLVAVAAVADHARGGLDLTRATCLLFAAVAATMAVLHVISILASGRLR